MCVGTEMVLVFGNCPHGCLPSLYAASIEEIDDLNGLLGAGYLSCLGCGDEFVVLWITLTLDADLGFRLRQGFAFDLSSAI